MWWSRPAGDPWRPPPPETPGGASGPSEQAASAVPPALSEPGAEPSAAGTQPGESPSSVEQQPYVWGFGAPGSPDTLGDPARPAGDRNRTALLVGGALAIALIAGGLGGALGLWAESHRTDTIDVHDASASLGSAPVGDVDRAPSSVAGIASRVLPSVVSIQVEGDGKKGTGSGFVIRNDGYLLTNNHVVEFAADGGTIEVQFSDGKSVRARIAGRDASYDLAVIKVDRVSGLTALPFGNSDSVAIGDQVLAIGSPLGLSGTVTSGIVSAKDRAVTAGDGDATGEASFIDALQTDAAINPGNSGGPLVNLQGRVVGVNSAIATLDSGNPLEGSTQGGSIGLGFSIPINQARRTAEQLIRTGHAVHPVIGVTLDRSYEGDGVRILAKPSAGAQPIQAGGPADKAGLKPGDVITKIDGKVVDGADELIVAIRSKQAGDKVKVTYRRGGKESTVDLTLAAAAGQQ